MSDFAQIVEEELAASAEDFPAESDDETAWHFTDKNIRSLLCRVAGRVIEQHDACDWPGWARDIAIERDEAQTALSQEMAISKSVMDHRDELIKQMGQLADAASEVRRKNGNLVAENLRLVVEIADAMQTIHDQAEIIERYEARKEPTK